MKARSPTLVLLAFALLALIMEAALALYWHALLQPRLYREAAAQAQVVAQAQAAGIAQALSANTQAERVRRLDEVIDGLLLMRDPERGEPYFDAISLSLDYGQLDAPQGSLDRREGEARASSFSAPVELYDPGTAALVGAARFSVGSSFFDAFSADVRQQLYWQGLFIAALLALLGGVLAWLLAQLERQQERRLVAERALAANERKLAHLIEGLDSHFVYARDAERQVVSVSDSVERVIGVSPARFLSSRRDMLTEDPINAASIALADGQREGSLQTLEFELRNELGETRRIECKEVTVRDAEGREIGFDGLARDVTEQRAFEAELRAARDAAESANRSKSQFLANMSHEIRTPMNAILGMTQLLDKSPLNARQQGHLRQLGSSARLLLGIIDDILDLSRIEAGKLALLEEHFSLDELLTELTSLVGHRAREKHLDVLIDLDPGLPKQLVGDALRLQQVLTNLTVNAIKFTEKGEVVIRIAQLGEDAQAVRLRFEVADSGIGIPQAEIPRLFDQFTQMDESSTRQHGGAGLGLAICKRLVALMGGTIAASSEPGRGSRFWFDVAFQRVAGQESAPALPSANLRALVVDDSPAARDVFGSLLESARFEVRLADSGERAMDLLRQDPEGYDLLLIDYRLPGQDGLDVVRQLPRHGKRPATVMVTAFGDEQLAIEAERQGVDVFLHKPASPSSLFDAVVRALHGKGAGRSMVGAGSGASAGFRPGQRVLVAEDNEINREVAAELLRGLSLEVSFAENGRIALERLAEESFDAVLMDVQMPEMDGVEATRRIKADPRLAATPVIALTAHAMASDRDRFIAAGMDDYLSKPIEEADLLRVLGRWLHTASATAPVAAMEHPADDDDEAWPGIDMASALRRVNGKRELLCRLLDEFRHRNATASDELRELLAAGERQQALDAAHRIKGAAATLGATAVAEAAASVERAVREDSGAETSLDTLANALGKLASLNLRSGSSGSPVWSANTIRRAGAADVGAASPAAELDRLQEALEQQRYDALGIADELVRWAPSDSAHQAELRALRDAVRQMDFEVARILLAALRATVDQAPREASA